MNVISSTPNGQIFICSCHNNLSLEFGNIFMHLTCEEFNQLVDYVSSIDYKFWLKNNRDSQNRRKLLLHIGSKNSFLALNRNEFIEFRELLSLKNNPSIISNSEIIAEHIVLN